MVLWAIILAASVEVGLRFGVNILLVDMEGNVAGSQDDISWVVTVYGAGFIYGLATSAGLARFLGARKHFSLMLVLFGVGTLGCFLSHELWQLLTARAIQGVAGGTFVVRGQVLIYGMFQGRERSARSLIFGVGIQGFRALLPLWYGGSHGRLQLELWVPPRRALHHSSHGYGLHVPAAARRIV